MKVLDSARPVSPSMAQLAARACVLLAVLLGVADHADAQSRRARLSRDLQERLSTGNRERTSVIVTGTGAQVDALAARHGLTVRRRLRTGAVLDVPAGALETVAADASVDAMSSNQPIRSQMGVTNQTIGADRVHAGTWAANVPGLTGRGIGVAVIDSGVAEVPELKKRVIFHKDFTGTGLRDLHGHGTHVAGIIAAAGRHDGTTGVAPGANIISLKVLDGEGMGDAGSVIEAIDFAIANKARFNIRVINLSLGGAPLQSWRDDPLCQAVERAYRAGIFVVAAAGNRGKLADGRSVYGGISTPGISPFAFTVGALNTKGTPWAGDDEVASYSSKGPTHIDDLIKPDLVAPGNRIRSLAAPGSTLVREHPELVIDGPNGRELELSGTSMAAGVVSGAAALLSEYRPSASHLPIRLKLQFGAEAIPGGLVQRGAGTLNVVGSLAAQSRALKSAGTSPAPVVFAHRDVWTSGVKTQANTVVWGNRVVWGSTVAWGSTVVWGNTVVWDADDTVVWGTSDTVVWGSDDTVVWGAGEFVGWKPNDSTVWGSTDTVVRGASDTVVWGSDDTVVWGADDTVVWGAAGIYAE